MHTHPHPYPCECIADAMRLIILRRRVQAIVAAGALMTFKSLPMGCVFVDSRGDTCRKIGDLQAVTPDCAPGFSAGFKPDERVRYLRKF